MRDNLDLIIMMGLGILLTVGILLTIRQVDHHYSAIHCRQFSIQTERNVKFVDYSFFSYECLTVAKDGKWLPINSLREIAD